jgi:pimeloyl-ACP methyl ester carboxylesterase
MASSEYQSLSAPGGRTIGFAEYGEAAGYPVLYCHGFPASRLEGALLGTAARRAGARIIALDRPGYGLSTHQPQRALAAWPADVALIADVLGLRRFAVLGVSGGGPYALACATRLGERLTATGIVAGLGPLARPESSRGMGTAARLLIGLARSAPDRAGVLLGHVIGPILFRYPRLAVAILTAVAPPVDLDVLCEPGVSARIQRSIREAFRQGGAGPMLDLRLFTRPWNLDPSLAAGPVHLWHGERDRTVPVTMGRELAALLPACTARFLPEEGHFSMAIRHGEIILAALRPRAATAPISQPN